MVIPALHPTPSPTESSTMETTTNQRPMYSCKELLERNRALGNGVYQLKYRDSPDKYQVHCHMSEIDGCEGKGWTLVMKMDGTKVKNQASHKTCFFVNINILNVRQAHINS